MLHHHSTKHISEQQVLVAIEFCLIYHHHLFVVAVMIALVWMEDNLITAYDSVSTFGTTVQLGYSAAPSVILITTAKAMTMIGFVISAFAMM